MQCQRCGSTRILVCNAHASDCQDYSIGDREYQGYAPHVSGVMGGDNLSPDICLDCGQVQGAFPKPAIAELEAPQFQYCKPIQYRDRIYGRIDAEMRVTWDGKTLNLDDVSLQGEENETIGNAQARLERIPEDFIESERKYLASMFEDYESVDDPALRAALEEFGVKFLGKL